MEPRRASEGSFYFDHDAAQLAVDFIQALKHTKGPCAGQYFRLEPWQDDIIRTLFGWKNPDGTRRYRKMILEIARGNGKTMLCAAIALYMLFVDPDQKPEIYCAASDKETAGIAYEFAADIVRQDPSLTRLSKTVPHKKTIFNNVNRGFFKAISSEGRNAHGTAANLVLIDELHAWSKPGSQELYDALLTGLGKRKNSLLIIISTAGHEKYSIFGRELEYAKKVRDGKIKDDRLLVRIYEADPTDPLDSPDTWRKANPNLGVSVFENDLAASALKAKNDSFFRNTFKRLHLNIWTTTETAWLDMPEWDRSQGPPFDLEELRGKECYAGLDLSTKFDLTAFVLVFPWDDGSVKVVPYFFIPKDTMWERIKNDGVEYDAWAADPLNHLILTDGNAIDYAVVLQTILDLSQIYQIKELAFDKAYSNMLIETIHESGVTVASIPQTPLALSEATMEVGRLVAIRKLHHNANPILRWNASCATLLELDSNLVKIVKPKRRKTKNRIDGIVALVMAVSRMILHKKAINVLDNLIEAYK